MSIHVPVKQVILMPIVKQVSLIRIDQCWLLCYSIFREKTVDSEGYNKGNCEIGISNINKTTLFEITYYVH